jgi:hypothetical protein
MWKSPTWSTQPHFTTPPVLQLPQAYNIPNFLFRLVSKPEEGAATALGLTNFPTSLRSTCPSIRPTLTHFDVAKDPLPRVNWLFVQASTHWISILVRHRCPTTFNQAAYCTPHTVNTAGWTLPLYAPSAPITPDASWLWSDVVQTSSFSAWITTVFPIITSGNCVATPLPI